MFDCSMLSYISKNILAECVGSKCLYYSTQFFLFSCVQYSERSGDNFYMFWEYVLDNSGEREWLIKKRELDLPKTYSKALSSHGTMIKFLGGTYPFSALIAYYN